MSVQAGIKMYHVVSLRQTHGWLYFSINTIDFGFSGSSSFFLFHVVYVPLILSSMSDLPGAQNRSKSTLKLKLGIIIWLLMQPVGTVCQ